MFVSIYFILKLIARNVQYNKKKQDGGTRIAHINSFSSIAHLKGVFKFIDLKNHIVNLRVKQFEKGVFNLNTSQISINQMYTCICFIL